MAKNVADNSSNISNTGKKTTEIITAKNSSELSEEFLPVDPDSVEFESEEEVVTPSRANQKDPLMRRKIEDLLERRRLREELGIYDDAAWDGL